MPAPVITKLTHAQDKAVYRNSDFHTCSRMGLRGDRDIAADSSSALLHAFEPKMVFGRRSFWIESNPVIEDNEPQSLRRQGQFARNVLRVGVLEGVANGFASGQINARLHVIGELASQASPTAVIASARLLPSNALKRRSEIAWRACAMDWSAKSMVCISRWALASGCVRIWRYAASI
jgi:hypothetical protein